MTTEQCPPRDEAARERIDGGWAGWRDWRREGRRWWEKAEAWDPERWKAMAAAWASMWQDGPGEAGPGRRTSAATKLCPFCAEEIKSAAIRCKHCGTWLAPPPGPLADVPSSAYDAPPRRLTRSTGDAMAFGVLGGLGRFFGVDPTWLRIAYALGTFFTAFVPGLLIYAMLAVIIPGDVAVKDPIPE